MTGPDSEGLQAEAVHIFERANFKLGKECTTLCGIRYAPTGLHPAPTCEACETALGKIMAAGVPGPVLTWVADSGWSSPVVPSVGAVPVEAPPAGAIDELATALMDAWATAEPNHSITKHPTSYVATFVDLARAAYPLIAARVQAGAAADERVLIVAELEAAGLVEATNLIARCTFPDDAVARHDARPTHEQIDRSHTEKAKQLLDALADQLRAALAATTPEPVTGATQDLRVFEVAAELAYPGIVQDRHEDRVRTLLMRADAADAAAGIRRVAVEEAEAQPTVEEEAGYYVVTFPDGSTSTWAANQSYLFDPGSILQRRRNASALDAIARYRGGAS